MERQHPQRFRNVLAEVASKIPGVEKITHRRAEDGRLLMQFNDRGYQDPFYARDMSDGTLKMFAYLLLLERIRKNDMPRTPAAPLTPQNHGVGRESKARR